MAPTTMGYGISSTLPLNERAPTTARNCLPPPKREGGAPIMPHAAVKKGASGAWHSNLCKIQTDTLCLTRRPTSGLLPGEDPCEIVLYLHSLPSDEGARSGGGVNKVVSRRGLEDACNTWEMPPLRPAGFRFRPQLARFRPTLASFGQCWSGANDVWHELDRSCPTSAHLVDARPQLTNFGQISAGSVQLSRSSLTSGRTLSKFVLNRAKC